MTLDDLKTKRVQFQGSGTSKIFYIILAVLIVGIGVLILTGNPLNKIQGQGVPAQYNSNAPPGGPSSSNPYEDVCFGMSSKESRAFKKQCKQECKGTGSKILFFKGKKRKKCEASCFERVRNSGGYC